MRVSWLFRGFAAHDTPCDHPHLVLKLATAPCAIAHFALVAGEQERWRARAGLQALLLPDMGQLIVMLVRPVQVDAAGHTVPLLIRCFGAALWASHCRTSPYVDYQSLIAGHYQSMTWYPPAQRVGAGRTLVRPDDGSTGRVARPVDPPSWPSRT